MKILFCKNPIANEVDFDWRHEYEIASNCGHEVCLLDYEAIIEKNIELATKEVASLQSLETCIYRGWMLDYDNYHNLYEKLLTKNLKLINNPNQYSNCHYFPNSYFLIEKYTAKTIITNRTKLPKIDELHDWLKPFGNHPVVIKDYVKSQKHYWKEACYIPNANDIEHAYKIISKFFELQGDNLQGGIIFREFIELESIGTHSKSKMPLPKEYRVVVFSRKPAIVMRYWKSNKYIEEEIPVEIFYDVIKNIDSNFFTMDIAKTKNGRWIIIELGDGQVAEFVDEEKIFNFYERLKK